MDEGELEYGGDSDIPPGPGALGDRSFGDRPFPGPGRERFREPWEFHEVHCDNVYFRRVINENEWITNLVFDSNQISAIFTVSHKKVANLVLSVTSSNTSGF